MQHLHLRKARQTAHIGAGHVHVRPDPAGGWKVELNADTLPRLARLAAQLYARSGNFTVLHLVTSAHALRVLLLLFFPMLSLGLVRLLF